MRSMSCALALVWGMWALGCDDSSSGDGGAGDDGSAVAGEGEGEAGGAGAGAGDAEAPAGEGEGEDGPTPADGEGEGEPADGGEGEGEGEPVPLPPAPTVDELMAAIEADNYRAELEFAAQPRPVGSDHHQAVQDRCAQVFTDNGFTVERAEFAGSVSVIGIKPGVSKPGQLAILGAHYDSTPGCTGADDNATGVAGVLEAARVLGAGSFERSIMLACWDMEEGGLVGSTAYSERLKASAVTVKANIVLEMIGYRTNEPNTQLLPNGFSLLFGPQTREVEANETRGDFIALIADESSAGVIADMERIAEAEGANTIALTVPDELKKTSQVSQLKRSDHAGFWDRDMPGVMVSDTADFRNPHYHCSRGDDDLADLDMDFALAVTKASIGAIAIQAAPMAGVAGTPPEIAAGVDGAHECDPEAACDDGRKCAYLLDPAPYQARCIDMADAPADVHEPCERPDGVPGADNCGAGLFCTFWGLPRTDPIERACLKLCDSQDDCAQGRVCAAAGAPFTHGLCATSCDPDGAADACGEGLGCQPVGGIDRGTSELVFRCAWAGDREPGRQCSFGQCDQTGSCRNNAGISGAYCAKYCRGQDDCVQGETCFVDGRTGGPDGFGHCMPSL